MSVGVQRLHEDLIENGFTQANIVSCQGQSFVVIPKFNIPAGSFAGRDIDLAIPAAVDYPRVVSASIHVKADPILFDLGATPTRNILASPLGQEWQYWSYSFKSKPQNPTLDLIAQINEIFRSI